MNKQQFNIGDVVFFVRAGTREKWITCPDCFGNKRLNVILGDGSQVGIDCTCCERGYLGSQGVVVIYVWDSSIESGIIKSVELEGEDFKYRTNSRYFGDKFFATREEAEAEQKIIELKHEYAENKRFYDHKEYAKKSWHWNVTYHRKELKEAERKVIYHRKKLEVCKQKMKSDEKDSELLNPS